MRVATDVLHPNRTSIYATYPMAGNSAPLDRRVTVTDGTADQLVSIHRVSDTRDLPFVVILGEPGMGKSTVIEREASFEGVPVLKVRELINGGRPDPAATLCLDALDEYRSEGAAADKAYTLARAIAQAGVQRWRLSSAPRIGAKGPTPSPLSAPQDTLRWSSPSFSRSTTTRLLRFSPLSITAIQKRF